MDFSRQMEVFNPDEFKTPVHIIGAGATGSWLTLFLAKMGVKDITVWDFDTVGEHNLPNQAFRKDSVGGAKVTELKQICDEALYSYADPSEIKNSIKVKDIKVTGEQKLHGIVFMLTDTMKSRKEIYEKAIKYKFDVKLLIETRMGLDGGRVYCINPTNPFEMKYYEQTLYDDDEAVVSACGVSQSIVATAVNIASLAVWQLIKFHNKEQLDQEILVDVKNSNMIASRW